MFEPNYNDLKGFPGSSDGKESACHAGELGSIPGSGRSPGGGNGNPLQYSCLGKSCGHRSLVGYGPRGHKESDRAGHTHTVISGSSFVLFFRLLRTARGILVPQPGIETVPPQKGPLCPSFKLVNFIGD